VTAPSGTRAIVYLRNVPEEASITVPVQDSELGITWISCPECQGAGVFEITDKDRQPCNYCKTLGSVPINC
jgi:hypothetical protein